MNINGKKKKSNSYIQHIMAHFMMSLKMSYSP